MRNLRNLKPWIIAAFALLIPLLLWARASAPPTGRTGAPGESTCTGCHNQTSGTGTVSITFPNGNTYTPGVRQRLTIRVSDSTARRWGYEATAVQASATSTGAGTFTAVDTNSGVQTANTKSYAGHTGTGTFAGTATSATWQVDWTPPATNVGNVVLYIAGLACNNDGGTSGDKTYTANYTLTPAAAAPTIAASPSSLTFNYTQNGTAPAAQNVSITSSGSAVSYTVATSATWLSATPTSGTTPGSVSVSANPTGLAPGTYTGNVTVTSTGASNSPLTIPVTLNVTAAPTMTVSPATLTFSAQAGGTNPPTQAVSVTSSGAALSYTVTTSATWLTATPTSGTTPGTVNVGVNASGLAAGTYNGTVTITSSGASNSPRTVAVTLTVSSAPVLNLSPTTLSFAYQTGSATPAAQSVSVTSSGSALSYTTSKSATWLSVTPATGTTPGTLSVSVNPSGLAAGTYSGTVTVTATGASNSPQTVSVTLTVTNPPLPTMAVSPSTLTFAAQTGGAAPAAQTVSVTSSGAAFSYTTTSSATWLSATPASGTTPGSVSVAVNPAGLAAGTYNGTVTVTSTGAANSPQTVAVTLNVTAPPSLTVSPSSLSFAYTTGGSNPASQTISVGTSGSSLNYTTSSSATWLSATPASGATPGSVTVSVNPAGLAEGTYNGNVTITSTGAANSPQTVPVTLTVASSTSLLITASPANLSFDYSVGDTAPAAKRISVGSSGSTLDFRGMVDQPWMQITGASGPTPGYLDIAVLPDGMAPGTYTGNVTIMASGASNSPMKIPVTLTVRSATLSVAPANLSFNYQVGGSAPATQAVAVTSTAAVNFTATTSAAWLSASPTAGTTPGTVNVSINTAGLTAGNYTGSVTIAAGGASNSPQVIAVSLTVTSATAGNSVAATPNALTFYYRPGDSAPAAQSVATSSTAATSFTAAVSGGTWLSATPGSGTTPGSVSVSVNPTGLATGSYAGVLSITPTGGTATTVPVTLIVSSAQTGSNGLKLDAVPYTTDSAGTEGVWAGWVNGAGISGKPGELTQAVVLVKNGSSSTSAQAGVRIPGAANIALNELGFDIRNGQCTSSGPHFAVITSDGVAHVLACGDGVVQASPAAGWMRVRFDLNKALPGITPGQTITSLSLVLSAGPDSDSGFAVLDNIDVNGNLIAKP